ncbi:MAG: type I DNA topoisomerase [Chloroflexi bacterium]|nr:type I DNA topoisomerase [Chloroflexota bacterium]
MTRELVIVESPAKARTISRILGAGYSVKASLGHVRDLPQKSLGISIENNFTPTYVVIPGRRKTVSELKKLASNAKAVYLATDPDREGEAIAWHLIEATRLDKGKATVHRLAFHEITKEAVTEAFHNPRTIDIRLVDAQQARRLLDRLVGYKLSPLLWRKVQRGLSAGRVQSAAVRLVVDREREISNFVVLEYWTIEAELTKKSSAKQEKFRATLAGLANGSKLQIASEKEARALEDELRRCIYSVNSVMRSDVPRQPSPPFITSTLQQEAARKLRFSPKRTMMIAQQLYEGISIGAEGPVGLITYMRTDSTHVASSAIAETRQFISSKYGKEYLPPHARVFRKKGRFAQEAHEAIRPTNIHREPDQIKSYLTPEQLKLYELIWKRMVASQMAPAVFDTINVDVHATQPQSQTIYLFKATSAICKFPGFMVLYIEGKDENEDGQFPVTPIPMLAPGDDLELLNLFSEQHFTQPPPRYTEATLIKALEQKGIGRPSTYATIISTIQERGYVHKEKGRFIPEEIGMIVNDLLTEHFPQIVDLHFTAEMEKELDEIAQGDKNWITVLRDFYTPFDATLQSASQSIAKRDLTKLSDKFCPLCNRPMVIKVGRFGKFLACSGYPDCKKTMPLIARIGVRCPQCYEGELVERIDKKKRRFYGCDRYPNCDFTSSRKPIPQPCPQCGKLLVESREGWAVCMACKHKVKIDEVEKVEAVA